MALLGFTSFYREGFEVVLFLQSYRLKLGNTTTLYGVVLGLLGSGMIAIITFLVHRRLPYRRMLVATGVLLGAVLLVMVGEEAQEMQLAHWLASQCRDLLSEVVEDTNRNRPCDDCGDKNNRDSGFGPGNPIVDGSLVLNISHHRNS
jgi:high-affinity Fe2+/Pb2+ permease